MKLLYSNFTHIHFWGIIAAICLGGCFASKVKDNTAKYYTVLLANTPIEIDGLENEISWQNARTIEPLVDIVSGKPSQYSTRIKAIHDHLNIYFFIQLEEPHIWSNMSTPDTTLYEENCFEIFIDHNDNGQDYIELEINPLNTKFDLRMDRPYKKGGQANVAYNIPNIKHETKVNGTINSSNDKDDHWTIEISIPIKSIQKEDLTMDTYWRIHLARIHWPVHIDDGGYKRHKEDKPSVFTWQKQSALDNHLPKEWGYFKFEIK